jgi:hypothetical protein
MRNFCVFESDFIFEFFFGLREGWSNCLSSFLLAECNESNKKSECESLT